MSNFDLKQKNEYGYGIRLHNPEAFIHAVIRHFFGPIQANVDWVSLVHEARVALFEEDLRLGDNIPETTGGYWWRVARAVGLLLYEDYGIRNQFTTRYGVRPLSLYQEADDDPEVALVYYQKQKREEDPQDEVESKEWFDHYLGLAEGIILDADSEVQGERDLLLFELWVNGYSPQEIAENPEVNWFHAEEPRRSVDKALRRILHKLWEFFGVTLEDHAMIVGGHSGNKERSTTGRSAKTRFDEWIADPVNRALHNKKCADRQRRKRAEAKARKAQEEKTEE